MDFISYMNSLRNVKTEQINAIANVTESSTSTVYMWISGRTKIPKLKRKMIAQYLGRTVQELWPNEEKEKE